MVNFLLGALFTIFIYELMIVAHQKEVLSVVMERQTKENQWKQLFIELYQAVGEFLDTLPSCNCMEDHVYLRLIELRDQVKIVFPVQKKESDD